MIMGNLVYGRVEVPRDEEDLYLGTFTKYSEIAGPNKKFKVLLINICLRPYLREKYFFPIGLGYVATAIKNAGFDLEILDFDLLRDISEEEKECLIKNIECNVVAIGCIVTGYRYIKKLCETIKKHHDVPIIVGNSVASSIPEILLNKTKADIGVTEEGEVTIVELLKALRDDTPLEEVKGIFFKKNGEIVFTEEREMIKSLDDIPFIDYSLWDMEAYIENFKYTLSEPYPLPFDEIRAFPIIMSRGCLFKCTFCYHMFIGKRFRFRSVENVVKEVDLLKEKYGINVVFFADDLSLFSKKQVNEFADKFMGKGLYWSGACRAGLFDEGDEELLRKLKKSGCYSLAYALESADEEILEAMDKRISVEAYERQTKILHKVGISTVTSIVIGYPQETAETLQKTFDFCSKCEIYPSTGYLLPQPKTVMYDIAKEMGLIKDEEEFLLKMGDRQDFLLNFTKMSKEEIESITKKNLKKIATRLNLGVKDENLIKMGHIREKDFRDDN